MNSSPSENSLETVSGPRKHNKNFHKTIKNSLKILQQKKDKE